MLSQKYVTVMFVCHNDSKTRHNIPSVVQDENNKNTEYKTESLAFNSTNNEKCPYNYIDIKF